jgi:hypothetical protein
LATASAKGKNSKTAFDDARAPHGCTGEKPLTILAGHGGASGGGRVDVTVIRSWLGHGDSLLRII